MTQRPSSGGRHWRDPKTGKLSGTPPEPRPEPEDQPADKPKPKPAERK